MDDTKSPCHIHQGDLVRTVLGRLPGEDSERRRAALKACPVTNQVIS